MLYGSLPLCSFDYFGGNFEKCCWFLIGNPVTCDPQKFVFTRNEYFNILHLKALTSEMYSPEIIPNVQYIFKIPSLVQSNYGST